MSTATATRPKKPWNPTTHKNQARKQAVLLESQQRVLGLAPPSSCSAPEALQFLLDRTLMLLCDAAEHVDQLEESQLWRDTMVGQIPNEWIRLEADRRKELMTLAVNIERVGLAERLVSLKEAQAELIVRALAAAAADVGIPRDQVRALGPAFRERLTLLQGGQVAA